MKKELKNKSASFHDRLNNLAKAQGKSYNELFYIYANQRLLYRLSQSPYALRFILKGAMAVLNLQMEKTRYTRDIDLLGFAEISTDKISQIFREICVIDVEDDGLAFDPASVTSSMIKLHDDYPGIRVHINVSFGKGNHTKLQVDIGFGDAVYPVPEKKRYHSLLDLPEAILRIYPIEAILSEKIHAIVRLDLLNSRTKDLYDIWLIASSQKIKGPVIAKALQVTFENRQTPLPLSLIIFDERYLTQSRIIAWQGIGNKLPPIEDLPELSEILDDLREFLKPLINAVYQGRDFTLVWDPSIRWGWQ